MKLSVVIPCRNAADTLGAQLEALAGQEWTGEWEVIVADNGSTDGTRALAAHWQGRLPGLRVVDAAGRRGASHARNVGAEEATGDALAFVDADDIVAPGWLAAMARALRRREFCASRFDYARLNPGRRPRPGAGSQERELQYLWYSPHVPHAGGSGLAIRRNLHRRLGGFDEGLRRLQDTDYCIRAALQGIELCFVPDAVLHVRLRPRGRAEFQQARAWARTNCLLYARHRTEPEDWRLAWSGYLYGWWVLARRSLRRAGFGDMDGYARRIGWKVGLLEGSLLGRVAPPDFRHGERATAPWTHRIEAPVAPGARPGPPPAAGRRRPRARARAAARQVRREARAAVKRLRRARMGTLVSVRTDRPLVALTFDDGPDPVWTPAVLDVLAAHGARATFFLVGERAARYPDLVRRIREEGHAVGNHGWSHRSAHELAPDVLREELRLTQEALQDPGGAPLWFRPPYGELDERAWRTARDAGYEIVGWSVLSDDWRPMRPGDLAARLVDLVTPGAIVVLHVGLRDATIERARDRGFLVEGLDRALAALEGRFAFVRLDELLAAGRPVRRPLFPGYGRGSAVPVDEEEEDVDASPRLVEGRLRISRFGPPPGDASPGDGPTRPGSTAPGTPGGSAEQAPHVSEWVADGDYRDMADNDLRGFLDGGFHWAWNQATQAHVRLGRVGETRRAAMPGYGEHELFRVLQRWDGLRLPPGARVDGAELVLSIERGCERPLEVHLYEARRDWTPGGGGVDRNNVSMPAPGEVWWNEAEADREAWTKPGAGHAADGDPLADTGSMPLATARYRPGDTGLRFRSRELARYAGTRIAAGAPLLLLLKLADGDEDLPGALLALFSSNHGDDANTRTRPRLRLRWRAPDPVATREVAVRLEYGRSLPLDLAGLAEPGDEVLFEWRARRGSRWPSIRAGDMRSRLADLPLGRPVPAPAAPVRLVAAERPVSLGDAFRSALADTWVLSGPPETQRVDWTFIAPSGRRVVVPGVYAGSWRWEVEFRPDEIGRWRYFWTHRFGWEPVHGPAGRFDVVAESLDEVLRRVAALAGEIRSLSPSADAERRRAWMVRLLRLERAAVALVPARDWREDGGRRVRRALAEAREALTGRPVPADYPRVSHELVTEADGVPLRDPYPRWQTPTRLSDPDRLLRRARERLLPRRRGRRPADSPD
ncbi:MAG: polysaccharide deacetylase family protein [Gemmatimonadota bacterium]|nr:polysaccharide deacetylase family protein [Gemmatimonadota bacterium]